MQEDQASNLNQQPIHPNIAKELALEVFSGQGSGKRTPEKTQEQEEI
jgi:hypothetical protein